MKAHRQFILNRITVGSVKVIVDVSDIHVTRGQMREIMDAALHAMNDNDLKEIMVKVDNHTASRDKFMEGYDLYRFVNNTYRLVDEAYEHHVF